MERGTERLGEPKDKGICWCIMSPSNIISYTHKVSLTWLPKCELNKNDTNRQAKLDGEKPTTPQHYTKYCEQPQKAGSRRGVLAQGRHTIELFGANQSALKTYIKVTFYVLNSLYLKYISIYIYVCNNNEWKRGHEFERRVGKGI